MNSINSPKDYLIGHRCLNKSKIILYNNDPLTIPSKIDKNCALYLDYYKNGYPICIKCKFGYVS